MNKEGYRWVRGLSCVPSSVVATMFLLILLLSASDAGLLGPNVLRRPLLQQYRRIPAPQALFTNRKAISLSSVADERRVLSGVRSVVSKLQRWGPNEWKVVGAPPMQCSSRTLSDGVRLLFYRKSSGGAVTEDGSLDITFSGQMIAFSSQGSRRQKNEDILYKVLLDEVRSGDLSESCTLGFGIYPPTASLGRLVARIDAACLVDKKGQYSRF